ncbi:AraC family transcriptional regulator [Mucilaginibacter sp. SJ]|uniref:AraC family transcriptional regulator n=1 Tax=Mucilaginibacter sp. SJ TaxID=3029053 RepID=UPI0023A9DD15|nr:AraC family transcriptional regulator [Mucilaginibacter sp. SJ]WEA00645.1 AraC family transcriptional regulator [Mucilaginibacter sp. SJ]
MKPQLLKVSNEAEHSFTYRLDRIPNINSRWHYHPEIELIHFHKGAGTQFVGDNVKRFCQGDTVLVGRNLPHYWKYDDETSEGPTDVASPYSTVIHFFEDFWSERFLNLPENKQLKNTLEDAKRGLQIYGKLSEEVGQLMDSIAHTEGPKRIIKLVEALVAIGECESRTVLSSLGFSPIYEEADKDRLAKIYDYSFANFKEKVQLKDIADIANIGPNSFCRYFKSRTGKTYSQFLTEIRVGYACKLLIESRISVKRICFECGYNNFSCFHTAFKSITGKSPLNYQHEYIRR